MRLKFIFPFLFVLLPFACQKEEQNPLLLSEVIFGSWERRELIAPSEYGDNDWHSSIPPFPTLQFSKDNTFKYSVENQIIFSGTFNVSDVDSVIHTSELQISKIKVSEFSVDEFVTVSQSREGPHYAKFFRIE